MSALLRPHYQHFFARTFATQPDSRDRFTAQTGWRQDGDELLETGIFPPARFLQFRNCPRYWCYQDYVPSDQEMKMCARIPAVLVGGGARVLIADV